MHPVMQNFGKKILANYIDTKIDSFKFFSQLDTVQHDNSIVK